MRGKEDKGFIREVIEGKISINDELLEENYGKEIMEDSGKATQPIILDENQ